MSLTPPRRTISEMRTLYKLHSELREIVVEGNASDRPIIQRYLRERGADGSIEVYSVDNRVDVPAEQVAAVGASVGAKGRVIALAAATEEWNFIAPQLTCIVDMDHGGLDGPGYTYSNLLITDAASLDSYFLLEGPVSRFLDEHDPRNAFTSTGVIETLLPALNDLFAVAVALNEVGVGVVERFDRCCKLKSGRVEVDSTEIIRRSLNAVGKRIESERVLERFDIVRVSAASMGIGAAKGHDIAPLLSKLLNLSLSAASIEREMRFSIHSDDLDDMALFVALRGRLGL